MIKCDLYGDCGTGEAGNGDTAEAVFKDKNGVNQGISLK